MRSLSQLFLILLLCIFIGFLELSILFLHPLYRLNERDIISDEFFPIPFKAADLIFQGSHQLTAVFLDLLIAFLEDVLEGLYLDIFKVHVSLAF
jgi:hypothetical protein